MPPLRAKAAENGLIKAAERVPSRSPAKGNRLALKQRPLQQSRDERGESLEEPGSIRNGR